MQAAAKLVAPQSPKAENHLLGDLIISMGDGLAEVAAELKPDDFYIPSNGRIFQTMLELAAENLPIEVISIEERLRAQEVQVSAFDLTNIASCAGPNRSYYIKLIREKATKRRLRTGLAQASEALATEPVEQIVEKLKTGLTDIEHAERPPRKIETLADLLKKRIPLRDHFVGGGLIARGDLVVFSGPQKKGKSLAALNLALCLSKGESWLGLTVPKALRVGIVQQEVPEGALKERLRKMLGDAEELSFLDRIPHLTRQGLKLDSKQGVDDLCRWLDESKVDFLQLDPLFTFHTGDENNPRDMGRIFDALERVRKMYNIAVLLIHHHGKPGQVERSGGDLHRGTSLIRDVTDANWTFTRVQPNTLSLNDSASTYVNLNFEQRHCAEPEPLLLHLDPQTLWFEPVDAKPQIQVRVEEVVEALQRHGSEMFQDDLIKALHDALGAKDRWCREAIYQARDQHLIEPGNKGHKRTWQTTATKAGSQVAQMGLGTALEGAVIVS